MCSPRLPILLLLGCLLVRPAHAADPERSELSLEVRGSRCSALLLRPADARALLVLAHGQAMDLQHPFMEGVSTALAVQGIATLRFNFPYAEAKRPRPDPMPVLVDALLAAVHAAEQRKGALALLVGGKSLGSLAVARAASDGRLPDASGLVILSFPLHAPGRASAVNARALDGVDKPTLFVQGTRDPLADLGLMRAVVEAQPRARMRVLNGADHGFGVPGRSEADVNEEVAGAIADFVATLADQGG